YYSESGKYNEVDGTGTIDEVRQSIFDLMDRF
ncbi:MAG: adenylate kinase, partial [Bacteroidetes bacterium]|nr:adenylate kinase [Candidatus Cryptobacteroides faecigallinarum]